MPNHSTAVIQTKGLILKQWGDEDLEPFAKLNADPRVMEFFPSVKTFEESSKEYEAILEHFKKQGKCGKLKEILHVSS